MLIRNGTDSAKLQKLAQEYQNRFKKVRSLVCIVQIHNVFLLLLVVSMTIDVFFTVCVRNLLASVSWLYYENLQLTSYEVSLPFFSKNMLEDVQPSVEEDVHQALTAVALPSDEYDTVCLHQAMKVRGQQANWNCTKDNSYSFSKINIIQKLITSSVPIMYAILQLKNQLRNVSA